MKKRGLVTALLVATMALATTFTSLAGEWKQDDKGWWYQEDDGFYPKSSEVWIDGNNDGMAECYYFDEDGYLVTTPFQEKLEAFGLSYTSIYNMNADGALMVDGAVQSRPIHLNSTIGQYSFVNENIKDIINKDVAYVDSVLGKADEGYSYYSITGEYAKYYQANNDTYIVYFMADHCVGISCKMSNMFNLTKSDYTTQDIALELGLEGEGYNELNYIALTESQDILESISIWDEKSIYSLSNRKTYTTSEVISN